MSTSLVRSLLLRPSSVQRLLVFRRNATTSSSGSIFSVPSKPYTFGLARVLLVSVPFIYCGAMIAKNFASFLEDYDIFVADDDDD